MVFMTRMDNLRKFNTDIWWPHIGTQRFGNYFNRETVVHGMDTDIYAFGGLMYEISVTPVSQKSDLFELVASLPDDYICPEYIALMKLCVNTDNAKIDFMFIVQTLMAIERTLYFSL